jgi:hypothetical protein
MHLQQSAASALADYEPSRSLKLLPILGVSSLASTVAPTLLGLPSLANCCGLRAARPLLFGCCLFGVVFWAALLPDASDPTDESTATTRWPGERVVELSLSEFCLSCLELDPLVCLVEVRSSVRNVALGSCCAATGSATLGLGGR